MTGRNKRMSHCHPQLLRGTEWNPPGSAGLTKVVEKGKGIAKDAWPWRTWSSHVTNIPSPQISSGTPWTMLSSPNTSFLETDSTIQTHWITGISFLTCTLFPRFLGVPYRRVSYSEDKISFQYKILYYSICNMLKFLLAFCVLGRKICLYLIKKKKNPTIYSTAKQPNQNHLSGDKSGTHVLMFSNKNYQVSFYISYCY